MAATSETPIHTSTHWHAHVLYCVILSLFDADMSYKLRTQAVEVDLARLDLYYYVNSIDMQGQTY
jgi:hypothetical protein